MKPLNIKEWRSTERKIVEWTQGVGSLGCKLKVREFEPVEGDQLDRMWTVAGVLKRKACPAFAIEDMAAAATEVINWFDSNVVAYVKKGLNHEDRLIYSHYAFAYQMSQEAPVSSILHSQRDIYTENKISRVMTENRQRESFSETFSDFGLQHELVQRLIYSVGRSFWA